MVYKKTRRCTQTIGMLKQLIQHSLLRLTGLVERCQRSYPLRWADLPGLQLSSSLHFTRNISMFRFNVLGHEKHLCCSFLRRFFGNQLLIIFYVQRTPSLEFYKHMTVCMCVWSRSVCPSCTVCTCLMK